MDYNEYSKSTSSEKVTLAWVEPSAKLSVFTLHSGFVYKKTAPEFVVRIFQGGTSLVEVSSIVAINSAGKWFFDQQSKTVYLRCLSNVDPDTVIIRADYRMFFSNGPFILPYDLNTGSDVEYLPLIESTSQFGYELDSEQIGIALEGQGSISFYNNDGFFEDKYEKYFWENKPIYIYSWSPSIPIGEKKKIYRGIITGKNYSPLSVGFELRDFIFTLNKDLGLDIFDGTEGDIPSSYIGTFKRRVYGKTNGLRCVPLDSVLDGFELTGTVSAPVGSSTITGTGTSFLAEASPDDNLTYLENTYRIKTVDSNTQITINGVIEDAIFSQTIKIKPKINSRYKNREWYISHHPAKKISVNIDSALSGTRLKVSSTIDFKERDICNINNQKNTIRKINGDVLVFEQVIVPAPVVNDKVELFPVPFANFGTTDFIVEDDYTISNSTDCRLTLDDLAEFNQTKAQKFSGTALFTNSSRDIVGTGTHFLTDFKNRDWIKPDGSNTWLEVLDVVDDLNITVRIAYSGSTGTYTGTKKNVEYLGDNSILTVTSYGRTFDDTESGDWIKYGPDVVKDLLTEAGLSSDINQASIDQAKLDAPHLISLKLPVTFSSKSPISIRDSIDLINQSIIGSVHFNSDFEIEVNAINSRKPPNMITIEDHDIIDWSVTTKSDLIVREFISQYNHLDANRFDGKESSNYKSKVSTLADQLLDAKKTATADLYLYNESSAEEINQRLAMYRAYSTNRIMVNTKLNLTTRNLNEKVYLKFDRMFNRIGDLSFKAKIGIIISIKKDGLNTIVELEDYSNIFNRIFSLADASALPFSTSDEDEKTKNGYLTDANGLITGYDYTHGLNLIG